MVFGDPESIAVLVVAVISAAVSIRWAIASSYREAAEANKLLAETWRGRAEAALETIKSMELRAIENGQRIAALEARPDLGTHAILLERLAQALERITENLELHETEAVKRFQVLVDRYPGSRMRTTDTEARSSTGDG